MPNWCMNTAVITAPDKKSATAFAAYLKEKEGAEWLSYFLPIPEDMKEDWYSWNINSWGTKWDCDTTWKRKGQTFTLSFDSAWAPPIAMYEHLHCEGWEVEAHYLETGMAFAGKFSEGFDECCNYGNGEEIPTDIDEQWGLTDMLAEWEEENEGDCDDE